MDKRKRVSVKNKRNSKAINAQNKNNFYIILH